MLLTPPNVNTVKVIDCLEFALRQMQPPNFLTGPYVIDRALDPRALKEDKLADYRRLGSMIQIKSGHVQLMDGKTPGNRGVLGGAKRKKHRIEMLLSMTISKQQDEAGIYVDSLIGAATHDVEWGIVYGGFIQTASIALNAANPSWGQAPSCINPLVTAVVAHPPKYPSGYATIIVDYMFDEYGPRGDSGRY